MAITVPMIEEKEFKTKVRGYDPVEVDEFLDEICDEMILMQEEISNLQARLAQASRNLAYAQPAPAPAPAPASVPVVADVSESAQKLMANAQRLYDETIAQAKEEAAAIIAKAKEQASDLEDEALTGERAALQKQVDELRASARAYKNQLLELMDKQRELLDAADIG